MLYVKAFPFNPLQENTYVVYDESGIACVIDPGCYFPQEQETLAKFVEDEGLTVVMLLNTHCHLDHVFGNKFVAEKWGLELFLHPEEQVVLDYAPQAGENWGLHFENYDGPLLFLEPGADLLLGADKLKILFTPGHSPGSVSFYAEKDKFVISGDVLFDRGVGRTDLPGGDPDVLVRSIHQQLFTLPDDTRVYPGHGPATTIGFEKMNNPFVKLM